MKTAPITVRLTPAVAALLTPLKRVGESWSDLIGRLAKTEIERRYSQATYPVPDRGIDFKKIENQG